MKSTIAACIALLVTVGFAIASPWIISAKLDGIEEAVLLIDKSDNREDAAESLARKLESERLVISLFLTDDTVEEMRGYISDITVAVKDGEETELNIAKSRLIGLIDQQRRLSSFDPEAIL